MGISYEDAVKAKKAVRKKLLEDPNVVSIAVVTETNELGEPTGDYAVQVGVASMNAYTHAQKRGQSAIPAEFLLPSEGKSKDQLIHFHVVKEGKIEALTTYTPSEKDVPSAMDDDLPETTDKLTVNYTLRRRPSLCGQSIGHPSITVGTLGMLLEYSEGPNVGKAFLLSNNHVLAANNLASLGDDITQPGKHDSGLVGQDTIAHLYRWVPLSASGFNYVDCAIAEVKGGHNWSRYVSPHITHIGVPEDPINPAVGTFVEKVGRTTGRTQGEIVSTDVDINIDYPMGRLKFIDQIRTTNMSRGGDSGSCLIKKGTRKPIGLLFAGSNAASYYNPLPDVLSSLSKAHAYQYPSGVRYQFSSDHPLRVLQRRSYSGLASSLRAIPRGVGATVVVACLGILTRLGNLEPPTRPANMLSFFKPAPPCSKPNTYDPPSKVGIQR